MFLQDVVEMVEVECFDMQNLKSDLNGINSKIINQQYSLAVDQCNNLLSVYDTVDDVAQILRSRSHVFNCMCDYESGLDDRLKIIGSLKPIVDDFYFAAIFSTRLGYYKKALTLLNDGLILSCEREDSYYFQEMQFLKAYVMIKMRLFDQALETLASVDDNLKIWIDRPAKPHTKAELLNEIDRNR